MIIEIGVAAAVAALGGLLAARALRKRAPEKPPPALPAKPQDDDPFSQLPARVGDVIQVGEDTRWIRRGVVVRSDGELICAVLTSEEHGEEQATVVMAPPDHHLYWLAARAVDLPGTPPARLEIDGFLLDRARLLTVELQHVGEDTETTTETGRFALYTGSVGDAAVVLAGSQARIYYGQRLEPGDYDCLGPGGGD